MFSTLYELYTLRKNLRFSVSDFRELQYKKLKSLLYYAYNNIPFYYKKFNDANVTPDDVKSIVDIIKIPITTKEEIRRTPLEDMTSPNIPVQHFFQRRTSGSTGIPLISYLDRKAGFIQNAEWQRAQFMTGLKITDKMANLKDPRYFIGRRWFENFGIMSRKWISIFDRPETQIEELGRYDPDIIRCYPSSLAILAHLFKDELSGVNPRLIFTSGELLDFQTREFLKTTFQADIYDNYVSNEFGNIAWECKEYSGYHINADNKLLDFVVGEDPVSPGEHGEIVCTSLNNTAMPLIRYKLGDIGIPQDELCSCGLVLPCMKLVEGRTDELLSTVDGRVVTPLIFFPYPFNTYDEIYQFKVVQERMDRMVIKLVVKEGGIIKDDVLSDARINIKEIFGDSMAVDFEFLDEIKPDPSGKIRKIKSNIPIKWKS